MSFTLSWLLNNTSTRGQHRVDPLWLTSDLCPQWQVQQEDSFCSESSAAVTAHPHRTAPDPRRHPPVRTHFYCSTVRLFDCSTVLLLCSPSLFCSTVLLFYCSSSVFSFSILFYCSTVLLFFFCVLLLYSVLLFYCSTVLLLCSPSLFCSTVLLFFFCVLLYSVLLSSNEFYFLGFIVLRGKFVFTAIPVHQHK